MKYMLLIIGFHETDDTEQPTDDTDQGPNFEEFMAFEKEMSEAGVKVSGHPLDSVEDAATIQVQSDGARVVTKGPFAETREYLGGYDIIDVPDLDTALDWAARCPGARYGRVEVRPVMEF